MKEMTDFSSIELLKKALAAIGYKHKNLLLGGREYTQFTSPRGTVWLTSNTRINYPFALNTLKDISKNKHIAYELAEQMGVKIPATKLIDKSLADISTLNDLLPVTPLVVKPNDASLSNGLTMHITNKNDLFKAIQLAGKYSDQVLVQQQVKGEEIRFAVLDGEVVAALLRQTPRVIGDGVNNIGALLTRENQTRKLLKLPYIAYPELKPPLINLRSIDQSRIPAPAEVVQLGLSTMIRGGASVYNVLHEINPSYVETAKRLAATLGNGFIVVDMFISDYRQPQSDDNYAFIEFNMAPVLKLFYSCRDQRNYDILNQLVPLIDRALA